MQAIKFDYVNLCSSNKKSPSQDPEEKPSKAPLSDPSTLFTANTATVSHSISISTVVKPASFITAVAFWSKLFCGKKRKRKSPYNLIQFTPQFYHTG